MAQNITLLGASYNDVPAVKLPKTGGGTATFTDVADTTATASDVSSSKYFYTAAGVKTQGSAAAKTSANLTVSGATVTAPAGLYASNASASVVSGSATTPATTITANPSISVSSSGLITASASATKSVTPTVSAGYVSSGTAGTITVSGSNTSQLTTQAAQTLYPSTTDQTITSGKYLTGTQTFKGVLLTNLDAGNIKKDVVVKVGDSADDDRIISVTGTYEGSGGGGSVTVESLSVTQNGTYTAPTGKAYSPVTVNVSGGGGTPAEEKDVNFIDYDGTILYSYTKTEFANLSALPANPTHTGLTAQGWNWSLSTAKTYVAANGKLWIGQMYTTSDGKTRLYIHLESPRLSPYLGIAVNGTATVEWGDGSSNSTVTGTSTSTVKNTQHNYAAAGDYVIAISVSGSMALVGSSSYGSQVLWKNSTTANENRIYQNAIQKVEIGANTSIGAYAFRYCYSLASITIPSGVTSISDGAFYYCNSLAAITIPSGVTSIGSNAFYYCYSLVAITIPSVVTSIGSSAFGYCYSLASITIPSGVTSIDSGLFRYCNSLAAITIPSVVTSIGSYMVQQCYSLASITIPSGVTSIGTYAFNQCYGLGEIHFKPTTPPPVSNSNAWTSLPTDCIIYVPSGKKSAYTSASNYPSSSTYTYVEE